MCANVVARSPPRSPPEPAPHDLADAVVSERPRRDGTVIAAFGRSFLVEDADGATFTCVTRGKRGEIACGDRVDFAETGPAQGVIEKVAERTSLLYRSDAFKQKIIAANVTQVVLVLATFPSYYEELLHRALAAAESAGIGALVVLNKCDLPEADAALKSLDAVARLGYRVLPLVARNDVTPLRELLAGHLSVMVGQSGMGKSTIVNSLVPEALAATAEVSTVLDSGKHTTTHARLYRLDGREKSAIIDSPGLQEFGLHHLDVRALDHAFVEFRPHIGKCRFANCRHVNEPDCAIAAAEAAGTIDPRRLAAYRRIATELERAKRP
jgi:ribosome biogenesis GTPase